MLIENNKPNEEIVSVIDIYKLSCANEYFRREIWTGEYSQITIMSIPSGGEIGLEFHDDLDQILVVEYGSANVYTGKTKSAVRYSGVANDNSIIIIPAGTWHNVINNRNVPLKLFSVYAPPKHPIGIIHKTKFESDLTDY